MELAEFTQQLPRKSKDELLRMRNNANAKGRLDCVLAVEKELDKRFLGWAEQSNRRGPTPTRVMFKGDEYTSATAKGAYIWLIEHFIRAYPKPFEEIDWETCFIAKSDSNTKKRLYFAKRPEQLFYGSESKNTLVESPSNWVKLLNGWYANTNLSNNEKFNILCRFAAIAHLEMDPDWSWHVLDETPPKSLDILIKGLIGNNTQTGETKK